MVKLTDKMYAIRSIISSNVDCEFTSVEVTLDEKSAIASIIELFPNEIFVDDIDDSFVVIDEVRASGVLNMYYDPDYSYIVTLYHQEENNVYALKIKA